MVHLCPLQPGTRRWCPARLDKTVALWRFPSDDGALAEASSSAEPGVSACAGARRRPGLCLACKLP